MQFVRNTLIDNILHGKVELPANTRGTLETISLKELGITHPVLVNPLRVYPVQVVDPNADTGAAAPGMGAPGPMGRMMDPGMGMPMPANPAAGAPAGPGTGNTITLQKFDFDVQFCWQPKTPSERHEAKEKN